MLHLHALFNLFSTPSLADLDGITDLLPMQTGRRPFGANFLTLLGIFLSPILVLFSKFESIKEENTSYVYRQHHLLCHLLCYNNVAVLCYCVIMLGSVRIRI